MYICIRPNLAMGIHTLGHTIRVWEGGDRQSCSHAASMYTYIEPYACVGGILYF